MWTTEAILNAKTKVIGKEMIQDNLRDNDHWLIRGILAIYARQTSDEQSSENTRYHNSIGFGAVDAEILSSFAKQILSWQKKDPQDRFPNPLSRNQLDLARRKIHKYAGQLFLIASQKEVVVV